jgi:hypothetical protein
MLALADPPRLRTDVLKTDRDSNDCGGARSRSQGSGFGHTGVGCPASGIHTRRPIMGVVWAHRRRHKRTQSQHRNRVVAFLPLRSGNLHVHLRRQRSSNLSRRRMRSHANSSAKIPCQQGKIQGRLHIQSEHSGDKCIRGTTLLGETAFRRRIGTANEHGMCRERRHRSQSLAARMHLESKPD